MKPLVIGINDWSDFWTGVVVTGTALSAIAAWVIARRYSATESDGHCLACGGTKREPRRGCVAPYHQEGG